MRHKNLHLITAFKKLRRITEPTVYRNPPYHSGMTPEPRTSTVFINLEDHRTLPGNMTPTTEEHFQRLYWRFWGFKQLQRARRSFGEPQREDQSTVETEMTTGDNQVTQKNSVESQRHRQSYTTGYHRWIVIKGSAKPQ
ncbi:hypothetical protein Bca101_100568 [Brassica carinata]